MMDVKTARGAVYSTRFWRSRGILEVDAWRDEYGWMYYAQADGVAHRFVGGHAHATYEKALESVQTQVVFSNWNARKVAAVLLRKQAIARRDVDAARRIKGWKDPDVLGTWGV